MGWQTLPDSSTVTQYDRLRVRINGGMPVEIGVTEEALRQYLTDYTMLSVVSVSKVLFVGWDVVVIPTGELTVAQVREMVAFALSMLRDRWEVFAPLMSVGEISVQRGLDISMPTTTTISLAAIALIVLIGFLLWSQVK